MKAVFDCVVAKTIFGNAVFISGERNNQESDANLFDASIEEYLDGCCLEDNGIEKSVIERMVVGVYSCKISFAATDKDATSGISIYGISNYAPTRIEKIEVCNQCFSETIESVNCQCVTNKVYPTVELEFTICSCCGSTVGNGEPCATEFNIRQLSGNAEKITPVLDGTETIDGQPIDEYLDELGR